MKSYSVFFRIKSVGILLIILFAFTIISCESKVSKNDSIRKQSRFLMDTLVTIQVPGDDRVIPVIDKALDRIAEVNKKFDILNPESILWKFNNIGTPVSDPEIIAVVERALRMSELSGGKFDITVYPLMKLYGFYDTMHLPEPDLIKQALTFVGYKNLVIKDGVMTKSKPGVGIDTGGIAKLYGIEEAVKILKKNGITSALIDLGGDVYAMGSKNGQPWKVGVRNPRSNDLIDTVEVTDKFVITSGDYERFFEKDGVRYHHLMDPATGYPARGLISVTIVCPDSSLVDGLSSSIFIMGREKGFELAKKLGSVEVMAITENQEIFYTQGFHKSIVGD
jgi:thiamine biosynthesis lipoprotein